MGCEAGLYLKFLQYFAVAAVIFYSIFMYKFTIFMVVAEIFASFAEKE